MPIPMRCAHHDLDPNTPIVVGVGQAAERIDDADYAARSAVELAAAATSAALDDAGAAGLRATVDVIAAVRQFEISSPLGSAPLGRSTNVPRSVAARVGVDPERAVLDITGGQSPQRLLNEFAQAIHDGRARTVVVVGAEAISTARHLAKATDKPDFSETVDGQLEDRGYGITGLVTKPMLDHGVVEPVVHYALIENARRARLGLTREANTLAMARLFAPFTEVAAANPYAAAPTVRSVEELAAESDANRMLAEPYTRYLVARDQVNQGAAVVLTSVGTARGLGIDPSRWVFLHGHADADELRLTERADLSTSPAAVAAARGALGAAGIDVAEVDVFDFYSCFPVAVTTLCDGLGIAPDDPRGLTVTGGLPYFGGPGNNYSLHAVAEVVHRVRAVPGSAGLVTANGGMLSKHSAGVYSTTPTQWRPAGAVPADLPRVQFVERAHGAATIESWTVVHGRDGRRKAIMIGRLDEGGARFLAVPASGDDSLLELLTSVDQPVGAAVHVRFDGTVNRVATSRSALEAVWPVRATALRDSYEFVSVAVDGHVLEVTINRPEARNALHPPANAELAEVFDVFESDPQLWVAIITGAGTDAFCAGNDLMYTAGGGAMTVPVSGFGGLTSRRLTKPVIAAVNGWAMGGGLEIVLSAHMTVADEAALFALSEVKVGLIAAMGGLVRLPRAVPPALAREMILTGRRLDAAEALAAGLVNRVVPAGTALDGARALAAEVLAASPTSVRASLQVMAEAEAYPDVIDAVTAPSTALDSVIASADTWEGLTAFAEKRPPRWTGR